MTLVLETETLSEQLQKYVRAIESMEQEKSDIAIAMREAFKEARRDGLDVKALRRLLKLRKMDRQDFEEQESTLFNYMQALGMR